MARCTGVQKRMLAPLELKLLGAEPHTGTGTELRSFAVLFQVWLHPWSWHVVQVGTTFTMSPKLALNSWGSPCLSLWSTGVTGVGHHTWLKHSNHRSDVLQLSTETAFLSFLFFSSKCWIKIGTLSLLNGPSLIWEEDFCHKHALLANGRLTTTGGNEI